MKVLFVLNCSYPFSGTGTNLINKLLFNGNLIEKIQDITILGGKESIEDADNDSYNNIQVVRASSYTLLPRYELAKLFKRSKKEYLKAIFEKTMFHFSGLILKNTFLDQYAMQAFYRSLIEINASSYDLVIAVSGRYYTSLAAAKYCKETGTPFIFYQVDPCASNQCLPEQSIQNRIRIETFLYEVASNVITTDLIYKDVLSYLPKELCKKVYTLEFPLVANNGNSHIRNQNRDKPFCIFSGSIYGGIRDPHYTFSLFKPLVEMGEAELHFVGVRKEELSGVDFVQCYGVLPIEEAMEMNQNADFLVNIGNSVTNQVPSKLFDYISTGKPIINICKSKSCPTIKYLEKYPCAINLFEDRELLEQQTQSLRKFIIDNRGKQVPFEKIKNLYEECTPEYCAQAFWSIIGRMEKKK